MRDTSRFESLYILTTEKEFCVTVINKITTAIVLLSMTSTPALAKLAMPNPGAFLYDAVFSAGPQSSHTSDPGHWKNHLLDFNNQATSTAAINRLYAYSGDIEMYCSTTTDCVFSGPGQNVYIYYAAPASGQASVAAYRAAFPHAKIYATLDGNTKGEYLKPLTYAAIGRATADAMAKIICADPNVDGVLYDLEPFDNNSAGQMALYKRTSVNFASRKCIDKNHPTGRTFGVFLSPNKITDWSAMATALGSNGFLVVSGYDLGDAITSPPTPTPLFDYQNRLAAIVKNMDSKSTQYKIKYTVGIPASASFSEFSQFGYYDAENPPSFFKLDTDYEPAITQLAYMQAAVGVLSANSKSAYYLGADYWGWGQYKSPNPAAGQLLMPNIPMGDVVRYLGVLE